MTKIIKDFDSQIEVVGSITKLSPQVFGKIVVAGSHGGALPGVFAIRAGVRAVILNDAGIGLEQAGTASLDVCQKAQMAAVTVSNMTCSIGSGEDILKRGIVSGVNQIANSYGVEIGQAASVSVTKLIDAEQPPTQVSSEFYEVREVHKNPRTNFQTILIDSASMVSPNDRGHIVVTGSHGGLVSNNPKMAIKTRVLAAFFNDAGIGIEQSGISRLPVLDEQGIVGVALDCMSCRIGEARSAFDTGIVSRVNNEGQRIGIEVKMTTKDAIGKLG